MIVVKRAKKYGFCAGVRIADREARKFAKKGGRGAILGQLVHNERVVEELEKLGLRTINSIDELENGEVLIFSAHGVPPSYHYFARRKGVKVLDTTCPFVYDIHDEASEALKEGYHLVFIGKANHREVIGYTNDLDDDLYHVISSLDEAKRVNWKLYGKIKIFFQTTLNADDYREVVDYIKKSANFVEVTSTICYATKENQEAARELVQDEEIDIVIVVGGKNSANTKHLWEICSRYKPSYLVHDTSDLKKEWFVGVKTVGLTAGASTPDSLIDDVENAILEISKNV